MPHVRHLACVGLIAAAATLASASLDVLLNATSLSGLTSAVVGAHVYYFGGTYTDADGVTALSDAVIRFSTKAKIADTASPPFELLTTLPRALTNTQAYVKSDTVFITGGLAVDASSGKVHLSSQFYALGKDIEQNKVVVQPVSLSNGKMPAYFGQHLSNGNTALEAYTRLSEQALIFGSSESSPNAAVFNTWNQRGPIVVLGEEADANVPSARKFASIIQTSVQLNFFFMTGGIDAAGKILNEYRSFDGRNRKWLPKAETTSFKLVAARYAHCSVIYKAYVIHIGGVLESPDAPVIEYLNLWKNETAAGTLQGSVRGPTSLAGCSATQLVGSNSILVAGNTSPQQRPPAVNGDAAKRRNFNILNIIEDTSNNALKFEWSTSYDGKSSGAIGQMSALDSVSNPISIIAVLVVMAVIFAAIMLFFVCKSVRASRKEDILRLPDINTKNLEDQ